MYFSARLRAGLQAVDGIELAAKPKTALLLSFKGDGPLSPANQRSAVASSDLMLNHLTSQQHLHPHRAVREVLDLTVEAFGCCPQAIARGVDWLGIDETRPIGRLRRSELLQLARSIHRFWQQNLQASTEPAK
jgi:hypothetical protein